MPITCRTARIAITIIAGLLTPPVARATPEAAEAWFRAAWEAPLPTIDDMHLRVIVESHEAPTRAELAAWRREIEGRPDHPRRRDIEIAERRLAHGPDVHTYDIWLGPDNQGRVNLTEANGYVFDVAVYGRNAWGYSPSQLTVALRDRIPPEYNYPAELRRVHRIVQSAIAGGFSVGNAAYGMQIVDFTTTQNGENWTANVGFPDRGMMLRLAGTFDAETGRGFATEARVTRSDESPDERGRFWRYGELATIHSHSLATVSEEYFSDGRLDLRYRIESPRPLERDELQRVTAIPDPSRHGDAVRGAIGSPTLVDHRPRSGPIRVIPDPDPAFDNPPPVRGFGFFWLLSIPVIAATVGAGVLLHRRHHT